MKLGITSSFTAVTLVALGLAAALAPVEARGGPGKGQNKGPKGRDKTAPALTVPSDITTAAMAPFGAYVTFSVSATDDKDPYPLVTVSPPSGSTFRVGTTTVTATATDSSGNSTTKTFDVTVTPITGAVSYKAYFMDEDYIEWYEWDITIAADGTVSGSGGQVYVIGVYDGPGYQYAYALEPVSAERTGTGVISGTISASGSSQITSSRTYWYWHAFEYDADGNLVYTEDTGGFSGSMTATLDSAGNVYFSASPTDSPGFAGYAGSDDIWIRQ